MTVVNVPDQYVMLMAVTLLFTVLGLAFNRKIILTLLAGTCWLISALAHFAVGDQTSPLTLSLSWLFLAIGLVFIVKTMVDVFRTWSDKRWSMEL